jgi:hypothetical protein
MGCLPPREISRHHLTSSFGFLSSAQETMTIVHIVLFEFKPTVHHEVVQDVSLYSISCAGCRAAGFEHPILFCAFIRCPSKNPLKREYEADANRPCFTGLQAYASPTTELHPPHVEAAVHHRVHRGSGPLPRRPSSCQTPAPSPSWTAANVLMAGRVHARLRLTFC